MEDSVIAELEDAAHTYVAARDRRMELTQREVPAKQAVLDLMKKHGKVHYKRDGIEITLISEKEKVKVRTVGSDEAADEE